MSPGTRVIACTVTVVLRFGEYGWLCFPTHPSWNQNATGNGFPREPEKWISNAKSRSWVYWNWKLIDRKLRKEDLGFNWAATSPPHCLPAFGSFTNVAMIYFGSKSWVKCKLSGKLTIKTFVNDFTTSPLGAKYFKRPKHIHIPYSFNTFGQNTGSTRHFFYKFYKF